MKYLPAFVFLICLNAKAQNNDDAYYVFKEDWTAAKGLDDAYYFMHQVKENDSTYVCRYYFKEGTMVRWETYADASLTTPMGRFAWYNEKGMLDSTGYVYKGLKDGDWRYFNDTGMLILYEAFDKGKFQEGWNYLTKEIRYADSRTEKMDEKDKRDSLRSKEDTLLQAKFKKGNNDWMHYLTKNLKVPERFMNLYKKFSNITATVTVSFLVSTEGLISDVFIEKSFEWSVDMEAVRVIKEGPKWIPATRNGQPVVYRQKQNISFQLSEQ